MELSSLWIFLAGSLVLFANALHSLIYNGMCKQVALTAGVACCFAAAGGVPLALVFVSEQYHSFALVVSVFAWLVTIDFIVFCIATFKLSHWTAEKGCDYVVVLGGGLRDGIRPSRLLADRLEHGMKTFQAHPEAKALVVCGGQGSNEKVTEALAMARYLKHRGFPPDRIVMEDRSATTLENLEFARDVLWRRENLFGAGEATFSSFTKPFGLMRLSDAMEFNEQHPALPRILVVTSNFHAFRTWMLACFVPGVHLCGMVGKPSRWYYLPGALVRDFVSTIVHALRILLNKER